MSTINLLPKDFYKRREQIRISAIGTSLFLIVMTGVAWASMKSQDSHDQLAVKRQQVNQRYLEANQVIQKMHALEQRRKAMATKAHDTAELMERMPRSYLLGLTTQLCPKNVSLREFQLITKPVQPGTMTKFQQAQAARTGEPVQYSQEILLTGYAKSKTDKPVAKFLEALERSPLIVRADLESSVDIKDKDLAIREFKFHLYLAGDIDVMEVERPRGDTSISLAPAPRPAN
ncbi:MAG: PilN domain-containing protein [Phycisphaerae bacterium]